MSETDLHIVSFDIPLPANYGGVIDVFYKIKSLSDLGIKIHLHCFTYGRTPALDLEKFCYKVTYYPRNISKSKLLNRLPYIVCSRDDEELKKNLLSDSAPILFEGLHTTFHLQDESISAKHCFVRTHNIEHDYYRHLSLAEGNLFKRVYFSSEATKLESYEKILKYARGIAAISPDDTQYFKNHFGEKAFYLPAFHESEKVNSEPGFGNYALYHGNLSVAENEKACLFLVKEIFSGIALKLIIAGNHPSSELKSAIKQHTNILLIENPEQLEMNQLIREAHIHTLPTFQPTGIKLKLLTALYQGRHVLVNPMMVEATGLEELCEIASDAEAFKKKLNLLMETPFNESIIEKRQHILERLFSNHRNALHLKEMIFKS